MAEGMLLKVNFAGEGGRESGEGCVVHVICYDTGVHAPHNPGSSWLVRQRLSYPFGPCAMAYASRAPLLVHAFAATLMNVFNWAPVTQELRNWSAMAPVRLGEGRVYNPGNPNVDSLFAITTAHPLF